MHRITALLATLALWLASSAASATILYEFTAESSFISSFDGTQIDEASFVLETPDFISIDSLFGTGDLVSCSVLLVGGTASCNSQEFLFNQVADTHTIGFGLIPDNSIVTSSRIFYYFETGAFSTPGSYETILFGDDQFGRLTVSRVPAPITVSLLLIGLLALGWQRRLR